MSEPNQEQYSEPPWVTAENKLKQTFYRQNVDEKLVPKLSQLPVYPEMIQRLASGQILVDIGCFIGHDLRHLVNDGAPSENLYGLDIVNFWDLGYEMFQDSKKFNAHFIEADLLSSDRSLETLEGRCGIISISQVLHQWDWNGQLQAAKALCKLSAPGSMVVGNQIGNYTASELTLKSLPRPVWRHNVSSFAQLWEQVGTATNTRWECSSSMKSFTEIGWPEEDAAWLEDGARVVEFVVRRLS
ncbi:hypothetical protein Q7P37_002548 [Cladosporium fusiforme]